MKSFLFFLIIFPLAGVAQQRDSLLQVIEVYGIPPERFLVGSQVNEVDSSLRLADRAATLSDLLSRQFPIYFRNYGSGMISGISLRGTSPQHTAVLWNGININSFSLGQADFSLLPSNAFSSIKLHEGGGSAKFGSGAFGGTVMLGSHQEITSNKLEVMQQVGSFQKISTSVANQFSVNRWSIATKVYNTQSENNFPVEDLGRQPHAAYQQRGLLHDMTYRLSGASNIHADYWIHHAWREIQPTIGQTQSNDEQEDLSHRLCLSYRSNTSVGYFNVTTGYVKDEIVFNGNKSVISRFIAKSAHQYSFGKKVQTEVTAEMNYIDADIEEYTGNPSEYRFDVFGGAVIKLTSRLNVSVDLRQPFVTGFTAPLLPYVGAEYRIISGKHQLTWTANGSRNYRIPTFNDRYWQDAGAKDLSPEDSYSAETSLAWTSGWLHIQPLIYAQTISQWIQWIPDGDGNYEPRNVKRVAIRGAQIRTSATAAVGNFKIAGNVHYQYAESVVKEAPANEQYSIGKQLIYTPLHTASLSFNVERKQSRLLISSQYNSERFIDPANSDLYALDGYTLVDISVGHRWTIAKHILDANIGVNNVLDQRYRMFAGRAMPGRNYNVQITYQLNYKSK